MAVEQAGQHRAVALDGLDTVRQRRPPVLDAVDPVVLEQYGGAAGKELGPVEGVGRADRIHLPTIPKPAPRS